VLEAVESAKAAAGAVYKEGKYEEAIAKYSEALGRLREIDPDDDDEIEAARGSAEARLMAGVWGWVGGGACKGG